MDNFGIRSAIRNSSTLRPSPIEQKTAPQTPKKGENPNNNEERIFLGDTSGCDFKRTVGEFSPRSGVYASNITDLTKPNRIKSACKGSSDSIEFDPRTLPSITTSPESSEEEESTNGSVFTEAEEESPMNRGLQENNNFPQSPSDLPKKVPITVPRYFTGRVAITKKALQQAQEFMKTDKLQKTGAYLTEQEKWASEKLAIAKEDLEKAELGLAWAEKNTKFNQTFLSAWYDLAQRRYEHAAAFASSLSQGLSSSHYNPATSSKNEIPEWSKPIGIKAANIKQIVDSCAQAAKAEEQAHSIKQQLTELRQLGGSDESEETLQLEKKYREAEEQRRASAYQAHSLYKAVFPNA